MVLAAGQDANLPEILGGMLSIYIHQEGTKLLEDTQGGAVPIDRTPAPDAAVIFSQPCDTAPVQCCPCARKSHKSTRMQVQSLKQHAFFGKEFQARHGAKLSSNDTHLLRTEPPAPFAYTISLLRATSAGLPLSAGRTFAGQPTFPSTFLKASCIAQRSIDYLQPSCPELLAPEKIFTSHLTNHQLSTLL